MKPEPNPKAKPRQKPPDSPDLAVYSTSLKRFYITQVLWTMSFFMPTWVIFFQERHGLSLTQVTLVDLAFWMMMALTEVPTGAVADTYGRKHSMMIGIGLSAVAAILVGLAPNFVLLLIGNSLWGMAITFMTGADLAFFYDTLTVLGREEDYPRLRGRLAALKITGSAVGSIAGGILANWEMASPFLIYGAVLGLALLIGLGLKEPPIQGRTQTDHRTRYVDILKQAFDAVRGQKRLREALLYSNILPLGSMLVTTIFIQPHLQGIGIPIIWMGTILFSFSLVRIAASSSAGQITRFGGKWLWIAPFFVAAGLLGLALIPNMVGVAIFAGGLFASTSSRPFIEELILQDAPEKTRATILSVDNLIIRAFMFFLEPAGGFLADTYGLPLVFGLLAVGIWLASIVVLTKWRPDQVDRRKPKAVYQQ